MENKHYIYGPISSRRLGQSLGISPMLKKTCNYNCIYCQLGHTHLLTNRFNHFVDVAVILSELESVLNQGIDYDVISIVGDGEPTLYDQLEMLIKGVKLRTDKPVALITNGALLYDENVKKAALNCDIVLPSLDGYDTLSHLKICRPHKALDFKKVYQGIVDFSQAYQGQLWLEMMLMDGINDHDEALNKYQTLLSKIRYDKLYINVPLRPPSERYVKTPSNERLALFTKTLQATAIDVLATPHYMSTVLDDYEALKSILRNHPLNQFEIKAFIEKRQGSLQTIQEQLRRDHDVECIMYKGYETYRVH